MTEQQYDNIHNEGYSDGYNPIRQARINIEIEIEAARPKSIEEQKEAIRHQISIRDCSIARECGTFDQTKVDQLQAALKNLEDKDNINFLTDWPLEITKQRRIAWNTKVKNEEFGSGRVDLKLVYNAEQVQGWSVDDLRKAVKIHNL